MATNTERSRNRRARVKRNGNRRAVQRIGRDTELWARPFVAWDTEGYTNSNGDHNAMLFGHSGGGYINGTSLSSDAALDLICDAGKEYPEAFHVGFAFEYDVNMILKDLPWNHLNLLRRTNTCYWHGYTITHIPHKSFSVKRKGEKTVRIDDVFGFFGKKFTAALAEFGIGTEEQLARIEAGKGKRSTFSLEDMPMIIEYWREELRLMVPLMESIRKAAYMAGYFITNWHGPGALATYLLREMKTNDYRSNRNMPPQVMGATQAAYAGGRFQQFLAGLWEGPTYVADLNSAYVYSISLLPNLSNGTWHYVDKPQIDGPEDIARFALYDVDYTDSRGNFERAREYGVSAEPFPFFHRAKDGTISWPPRVRNWYWSPEVAEALKWCPREDIRIAGAWIYDDDGKYPFHWVQTTYNRRLQLQKEGNPAQLAFKLALNSIYGSFARRVGWDVKRRTAPMSHELAWAGYITSYCRKLVYALASQVYRSGHALVSIDTDGVTSLKPFKSLPNGIGVGLGEWKVTEYTGILQWQSGIYWLNKGDNEWHWAQPKTRGISRGLVSIEAATQALHNWDWHDKGNPSLSYNTVRFMGYKACLAHSQFSKWCRWEPMSANAVFGGSGKGIHSKYFCARCMGKSLTWEGKRRQPLHAILTMPPKNILSEKHFLPWLVPVPVDPKDVTDSLDDREERILEMFI